MVNHRFPQLSETNSIWPFSRLKYFVIREDFIHSLHRQRLHLTGVHYPFGMVCSAPHNLARPFLRAGLENYLFEISSNQGILPNIRISHRSSKQYSALNDIRKGRKPINIGPTRNTVKNSVSNYRFSEKQTNQNQLADLSPPRLAEQCR
jgi:hypothetical protein